MGFFLSKKEYLYITLALVPILITLTAIASASASPEDTGPNYTYIVSVSNPAHTLKVNWQTEENYSGGVRYDTNSQEGNPANYDYTVKGDGGESTTQFEGYVHHVELTGLKPDTVYHFICGSQEKGWSREFSFKTAPVEREHIRFVVGGDSRNDTRYQYSAWPSARDNVSKLAASYKPAFILFVGDYLWDGETQPAGDTWDNWLKSYNKFCRFDDDRLIPIIPIIGNHELEPYPEPPVYQPEKDASNFYMLFDLPTENKKYAYYSLDWGPDLHITVLDSEIRDSGSSPWKGQVEWLGQDLDKNENTLWKIAIDHRPPLLGHEKLLHDWGWKFNKYHLDIMFSGHAHFYERSKPVNTNRPKNITSPENGTIYCISGGWGAPTYEENSHWYSSVGPIIDYHFTLIDIFENGMLRFRAINQHDKVIDQFTLQKEVESKAGKSNEGLPLAVLIGVGVLIISSIALLIYYRK